MLTRDASGAVTIIVPVATPLMNQVLAMSLKRRMRLKDLSHQLLSASLTTDDDPRTLIRSSENGGSTELLRTEYYQTIRPSTSSK